MTTDLTRTATTRVQWADFVRAASLIVVVLGHYLMALVLIVPGRADGLPDVSFTAVLDVAPWSHPLTWVLQVMPCFFAVGAFVSARRVADNALTATTWRDGMAPRVRALVVPALPLLAGWALAGPLLVGAIGGDLASAASQVAIVPLWFLAVYLLIQAAQPSVVHAVQRWGAWRCVVVLVSLAGVVDWLHLSGVPAVGWLNFPLVWLLPTVIGTAVGLGGVTRKTLLRVGLLALAASVALVAWAGYPVPLVGLTEAIRSNNSPPSLLLGSHAIAYASLVMWAAPRLEGPLAATTRRRAALRAAGTWSMALYLWHMTALIVLVAIAVLLPVPGLDQLLAITPLSAAWWLSRPIFLGLALGTTVAVIALVTPATRMLVAWSARQPMPSPGRTAAATLCASAGISGLVVAGTATVPVLPLALIAGAMVVIHR